MKGRDDLLSELRRRLAEAEAQGLRRSLRRPAGIDFSSNDYLGLSHHAKVRAAVAAWLAAGEPLGAPASRLLRGNTSRHEELEARLANFKGTEAALLFASGYLANLGLLTALLGPGDRAVSDAANHASLIDGLRLAGCGKVIVPHLDEAAIEAELAHPHPGGRTFLVTESLFSMDGDVAPLDRYADLADRHGACLLVDDAHATGLYGMARGSGLAERFGVERRATAIVSTLGKALGLAGAFAAGPRQVVDYLVQRCRPFVFSTAPPPLLLAAVGAALDVVEEEPWRRARVATLTARLRDGLAAAGLPRPAGAGPIVPVVVGDNRLAVDAGRELARRGFDVSAVRPPTVPPGTARLRISVHADHSEEEIDGLAAAVAEVVGVPVPAASRSS